LSGASAISEAIDPSRATAVAPERSMSGQKAETENRGVMAARHWAISAPSTETPMAFRWNSGKGVHSTSSAAAPPPNSPRQPMLQA
jgi:hypothetical protein